MSDERVRLFVALELPGEVREELVRWRRPFVRERSLREVAEDALHVTLCFLGWQPATEIDSIARRCQLLDAAPAAPLRLDEGLWLPRRRPRVLAVRLRDDKRLLASLQRTLADSLQAGGWYVPERRSFLAHVTVARVGKERVRSPVQLHPPPARSLIADTVTLVRSHLRRTGARYEPLHRLRLRGTAAAG